MSVAQVIRRKIHRLQQPDLVAQIVRGAGSAFIVNGLGQALLGVMQIVLARVMGKEQFGSYSYVYAWIVFLSVPVGLGLPLSTVRFLPEYETKEDWGHYNGVVRRFSFLTLGAGFALAAVGTCFLVAQHNLFHRSSPYYVEFLIGMWMVPLLSQSNLISQMSRATKRVFLAYGPPKVVQPVIVMAAALFFWRMKEHVAAPEILFVVMASLIGTVLVQNVIFRRDLLKTRGDVAPVYDTKNWLSVSYPMLMMNLCQIVFLQVGILAVGTLMHARDVAIYRVASSSVLTVNFVLQATNVALGPQASALYATGNIAGLQRAVSATVKMSFYSGLAATAVLLLAGKWLLMLYGHSYGSEAYAPMVVLAIGCLIATGAGPVLLLMNMTGFERLALKVCAVAAIADVVANYIGIKLFGYTGAAIATATVQAAWNIALCVMVKKHIGINSFIIKLNRTGKSTDVA